MAFLSEKDQVVEEAATSETNDGKKPGFLAPSSAAGRVRLRALKIVVITLCCVVIVLGVILFFTEKWLMVTWSELSPDEILFHLNAPLSGTNSDMIWGYVFPWLIIELAIIAVVSGILIFLRKKPMIQIAAAVLFALVAGLLVWLAAMDLDERTGLVSYMASASSGEGSEHDFIGDHYVNPENVAVTFPEQKRNLIYIYLESMETTFADEGSGGAFEQNVIPELTALSMQNESFAGRSARLNGGIVLPGTSWTMGAIFGQSSGLPLKVALNANKMDTQDTFFNDITALGDILKGEGYRQMFLCGSEAEFGGRELYFATHGDFEIRDYKYASNNGIIPQGYRVFWGFEDSRLFSMARDSLAELAASGEPFNLTLLTVDTHFEDGYLCDLCKDEFDSQYANVMACSSRQVNDFIAWVQQQDFYANTTIVVVGDHTTMDVDFCMDVPADYQRKTYTAIINGAASPADPARVRVYSTFDLFPTTLAALGAQIEGDRLGLGTNLYSGSDTLIEQFGVDTCRAELSQPSSFLEEHAGIEIKAADVEASLRGSNSWVEFPDVGGARLVAESFALISKEAADGTIVSVFDSRTGSVREFAANLGRSPENYDKYLITADTDYTEEDLPYLTAYFYVTTNSGEQFHFATYPTMRPGWLAMPRLSPAHEELLNKWRSDVFVHRFG